MMENENLWRRIAAVVVFSAALPAIVVAQQNTRNASAAQLRLESCYVMLIDDVDVPARETGPLVELLPKEGQAVSRGDLLGKIDDKIVQRKREEASAKLAAAEKKAQSTVEIDYAQAASEYAAKEFEINRSLREKNAVPLPEYQKSALAKRQAELSVDKTRNDLEIEQLNADAQRVELSAVEDAIARHQIVSPLDGNVAEVFKQAGEWVQAGEKVLRIVRMNRLRVQGFVEASNFDPHEIDQRPVQVRAKLAHDRIETFAGQVVFVGLEKRGGSQFSGGSRFVVWAEVENRSENNHWLLIPGSDVELTIELGNPSIADAPRQSPAR